MDEVRALRRGGFLNLRGVGQEDLIWPTPMEASVWRHQKELSLVVCHVNLRGTYPSPPSSPTRQPFFPDPPSAPTARPLRPPPRRAAIEASASLLLQPTPGPSRMSTFTPATAPATDPDYAPDPDPPLPLNPNASLTHSPLRRRRVPTLVGRARITPPIPRRQAARDALKKAGILK